MANGLHDELPHNFDPVTSEAITQSGNDIGNPLNAATLKAFLTGYHFDRRSKKTTDQVKKLNPEAGENYVFNVYNQLFDLRETVDREKKVDEHRNEILQCRIEHLRKDLEKIVARGKIPPFDKNARATQLNIAATSAIQKTGLEGPLNAVQLESLITGIAKLFILVHKVHSVDNLGRVKTESRYFAQVILVQQFPIAQINPMATDNIEGLIRVEDIIEQLKQLRSQIITNKKNEKHDYDFIYERLAKAINGLRMENNFRR